MGEIKITPEDVRNMADKVRASMMGASFFIEYDYLTTLRGNQTAHEKMSELSRHVGQITDAFDNYARLLGRYAAEMKKADENSY